MTFNRWTEIVAASYAVQKRFGTPEMLDMLIQEALFEHIRGLALRIPAHGLAAVAEDIRAVAITGAHVVRQPGVPAADAQQGPRPVAR